MNAAKRSMAVATQIQNAKATLASLVAELDSTDLPSATGLQFTARKLALVAMAVADAGGAIRMLDELGGES